MRGLDSINRAAKLLIGPGREDFFFLWTKSRLWEGRLVDWKEFGVFLACERDWGSWAYLIECRVYFLSRRGAVDTISKFVLEIRTPAPTGFHSFSLFYQPSTSIASSISLTASETQRIERNSSQWHFHLRPRCSTKCLPQFPILLYLSNPLESSARQSARDRDARDLHCSGQVRLRCG
jgi:hypothetical protein